MKLHDPVHTVSGIGDVYVKRLKKLGIETIEDLLYHIPFRYQDFSQASSIGSLQVGDTVTAIGTLNSIENVYTRTGKVLQVASISDDTGSIDAIWMRQPYLLRVLSPGDVISLSGKVSFWGRKRALSFPQYEKIIEGGSTLHTGGFISRYGETEGISSKWLRSKIVSILGKVTDIEDFLPEEDLRSHSLLTIDEALRKVHKPDSENDSLHGRRRLAFDELLMLHVENNLKKISWQETHKAPQIRMKPEALREFLKTLPYKMTTSQERSLFEMLEDFSKEHPMNRLLEGDVGSGKTTVAAGGVFAVSQAGLPSILMAPTQLLAQQHYETLAHLLGQFGKKVSLVTGEKKPETLDADLYVGTHALLNVADLIEASAFVVIDEQHRFGVKQRAQIVEHSKLHPHVLTMTATPIPRTVALALYGDLSLSTLDELPHGRKKITTWIVPPSKRKGAEQWISAEIRNKKVQAFIVCPIIEDSETETMKSVKSATTEYERLKKVFKGLTIGLLHGRMKTKEKDKVLAAFRSGTIDILVATPVIEVGIDIPNATIMVIEAAERFGLAQLHQLRGRVGRGDKKSYCLLFTESKSKRTKERLSAVKNANSGHELAEADLSMRGPGQVFGTRQSGFGELKIANWSDFDLIKETKVFSEKVIQNQDRYQALLRHFRKKQISKN